MLVRLSLGTIVTRVAARAWPNAYSPARARICAARGTSDSATPPVITTTSGFRPFTTVPSIAPSARHASSTTDDATGARSLAARNTSAALTAREPRPAEPLAELGGDRPPGALGHVGHGLADPPEKRIHGSGHADADGGDRPTPAFGLCADGRDQPDDHRERGPLAVAVGRRALLDEHLAIARDDAGGRRRAADVHAEQDRLPLHASPRDRRSRRG